MITRTQVFRISGDILNRGRTAFASSKPFRYLVFLAAGFTALSVVSCMFGGSGQPGSSSGVQPPPIFTGTPSSQQPYQFSTPQQGPDPASEHRQRVLLATYDSLKAEARLGLKCERLADAVQTLTSEDRARLLPQIVYVVGDADNCRAKIEVSNGLFAALANAAVAFQSDKTPRTAANLAGADRPLTDFDRSRGLADTPQHQDALSSAQTAETMLRDSDARLKRFIDAAPGADSDAPLDAQSRLSVAGQSLTDFDQPRLTPQQQSIYDRSKNLADLFRASDRRIAAALRGLSAVEAAPATDRAGLVDAVGDLTPLDFQRASDDQKKTLERATLVARAAAMAMLVATVPRLGPDVAPIVYERVARIRRVIGSVDENALTPEQTNALQVAENASARIRASDSRAEDSKVAVEAWQKSPSPLAGGLVVSAYNAVTQFDHQHFSSVQESTFRQLEAAYYVVSGESLSLSAATKSKIPILVVVKDRGPNDVMSGTFTAALGGAGYRLATSKAGAAMIIELQARVRSMGDLRTSTSTLQGATAQVDLLAFWSADGAEFDRETAQSNGQGGTDARAVAEAFRGATTLTFERFNRFVELGAKP